MDLKEPDPSARVLSLFGHARRIIKLHGREGKLSSSDKLRKIHNKAIVAALRPAEFKRAVERELNGLKSDFAKNVVGLFDLVKKLAVQQQKFRPVPSSTNVEKKPSKHIPEREDKKSKPSKTCPKTPCPHPLCAPKKLYHYINDCRNMKDDKERQHYRSL
jgi:hypothetical protein